MTDTCTCNPRRDPCVSCQREYERKQRFTVYYYHGVSGPFTGGEYEDPLKAEARATELRERRANGNYTTVDVYAGSYDELHRFVSEQ